MVPLQCILTSYTVFWIHHNPGKDLAATENVVVIKGTDANIQNFHNVYIHECSCYSSNIVRILAYLMHIWRIKSGVHQMAFQSQSIYV